MSLPDKIVALHKALQAADIAHAFGGALALAWCTQQARGTIDIDLNIFLEPEQSKVALEAMPEGVHWSKKDLNMMLAEGQVRLKWDNTPIDLFLNTMKLHTHMSRRVRWETFAGESLPFLTCQDIAVLKVFFNRTKDWADLEAMLAAGTVKVPQITATIIDYLGADDERVKSLEKLSSRSTD